MLVETDSPYLAPVPHRGETNRPAWVPFVGRFIADLRDVAVEEIARATADTTTALFGLPPN
jgi:TatD DNase family protein